MIEHSEQINEIAAALAKAQAQIKGALKDSKNPHFDSRYAGLDSVWEAIRPALTENGISVVQAPSAVGKTVSMTTLLLHASGQWIKNAGLSTEARDASPQAIGSGVTYLRRYDLSAMAGVAPEDDDGNAAQGNTGSAPKRPWGRQELTNEQRRAVADNAPYAERERAKAEPVIDKTTGEVLSPPPKADEEPAWAEILARRAKLPADVQVHVPTEEDMHTIPPKDLTDAIPGYVEAITNAVKRRKLTPETQAELKALFLGNPRAQLAGKSHNPFFIYALFKHMRTDEP
jgi:hypothetical protein